MTNEQFSGQLRQHLLSTADERVADGQLASIVDRVALTSQRSTLVARLPWISGGAGLAPATRLRWALLVALALVGVTIAGAVFVGGSTPPVDDATVVPTQAPAPTPDAYPNCIQFDAPETYTALAGSMSLTVDVPGTLEEPWIGERDHFDLLQAACADWRGSSKIDAGEVTQIDTNACAGDVVAVDTYGEAVAAVSTANGIDVVAQTDVTLGGYPGTRFDITIPEVANACTDQQIPLVDDVNPFDPGLDVALYLIDVDGKTLALALFAPSTWSPGRTAKVDGILESLQIDTSAPVESSAPSGPSTADCIEFDVPGTYAAPAGSLSLAVGVPGTPAEPWIGSRSKFNLRKAACADYQSFGNIDAGEVTRVDTGTCEGVFADSTDEAIAAVSTAKGIDAVAQTEVTLGGYPGTRFDIRFPEDATVCATHVVDGVNPFEPGQNIRLYLLDVDSKTLVLALYGHPDWSPDVKAEVDEILASLQIETTTD